MAESSEWKWSEEHKDHYKATWSGVKWEYRWYKQGNTTSTSSAATSTSPRNLSLSLGLGGNNGGNHIGGGNVAQYSQSHGAAEHQAYTYGPSPSSVHTITQGFAALSTAPSRADRSRRESRAAYSAGGRETRVAASVSRSGHHGRRPSDTKSGISGTVLAAGTRQNNTQYNLEPHLGYSTAPNPSQASQVHANQTTSQSPGYSQYQQYAQPQISSYSALVPNPIQHDYSSPSSAATFAGSDAQKGKQAVQGYGYAMGHTAPLPSSYSLSQGQDYQYSNNNQIIKYTEEETIGENATAVRDMEGEQASLDPAYQTRHDEWEFFIPGRVFAILWWEPLGSLSKEQSRVPIHVLGPSMVKFGERAFAKIRRFVVVRAKPQQHWSKCIAISTHDGKATTKKSLDQKEHTIIYTGDYAPSRLPEERKLNKEAIKIVPVNPSMKLDPLSRVNLVKVYPVEHNLKVKEVGRVSGPHLKKLLAYVRDMNDA
ncbi:hypothetical protein MMC06_000879 [Schaereria dolodes]|nr:hypothetical protein [Schaereria dolodes]